MLILKNQTNTYRYETLPDYQFPSFEQLSYKDKRHFAIQIELLECVYSTSHSIQVLKCRVKQNSTFENIHLSVNLRNNLIENAAYIDRQFIVAVAGLRTNGTYQCDSICLVYDLTQRKTMFGQRSSHWTIEVTG